jgi:tRNA (cytidine/uridine-2'-O-)-methyltransferase
MASNTALRLVALIFQKKFFMKVVLYHPQIPQNTGNIVRTCSVTGNDLLLIDPLFSLSDRWLKRAGLDYWEGVNVQVSSNLEQLLEETEDNFYFLSSKASKLYTEVSYQSTDWLIFGSESEGIPSHFLEKWPERFLTIPMLPEARCLNLATSAGIVIYEAWRQQLFLRSVT